MLVHSNSSCSIKIIETNRTLRVHIYRIPHLLASVNRRIAMNLTRKTDISIRLLVYFADRGEAGATAAEAAEAHQISPTYTAKIIAELSGHDWLHTSRGRGSRTQLRADPEALRVGDVVRKMEPFELVECFNPSQNCCQLSGHCRLRAQLELARQAFLRSLDQVCIADLQSPHSLDLASADGVARSHETG